MHATPKTLPGTEPDERSSRASQDIHNLAFSISQSIKNTYSVWLIAAFIVLPTVVETAPLLGLSWFFCVGLVYTLRARILRRGSQLSLLQNHHSTWSNRMTALTLLSAAVSASAPFLLFPYIDDVARMYITMVLCCWLAGSMASIGARPRLYIGYVALFSLGVLAGWLRTGGTYATPITIMMVLYALILVGFAKNFAFQINEAIAIRFENQDLLIRLSQARTEAEAANDAKSRFLAVASHDLRQPLHAVSLLNGMLSRPQTPERMREVTAQMDRALSTLEQLFSSILDFSKIEADKVIPVLAWVDLQAIFDQLAASFSARAQEKGLALTFQSPNLILHTDPQLFTRILSNLIDNAIKFTESGKVTVHAELQDGGIVLCVSDTGPGIAGNLQREIFQEYFQGVAGQAAHGLGLGLAIVRRLLTLLDLEISVADNRPRGSRFQIAVPATKVRVGTDISDAAVDERNDFLDLTGFFVVYIDDDQFSRDAVQLLLTDWGCEVVVAQSADEAVTLIGAARCPDAVVSDYSLQDGAKGVEAIEALRSHYGEIAAAILTGESDEIQQQLAIDLEYPVLKKPVSAHELRALLEVFKSLE
jgi:signal transduction histidine kinase/CheY-like chemotaxis protein